MSHPKKWAVGSCHQCPDCKGWYLHKKPIHSCIAGRVVSARAKQGGKK